jgi:hypothetical protein
MKQHQINLAISTQLAGCAEQDSEYTAAGQASV